MARQAQMETRVQKDPREEAAPPDKKVYVTALLHGHLLAITFDRGGDINILLNEINKYNLCLRKESKQEDNKYFFIL